MAKLRDKLNTIEDLSNAFIDENSKTYNKDYQVHLDNLQSKAIGKVLKGKAPTQEGLFQTFRVTGINRNIRNAYIMSNVALLVQHDRNGLLRNNLKPINNLTKLYSPRNPILFAAVIDKLVQKNLGAKVILNKREQRAYRLVNGFLDQNKKEIQKLVDTSTKKLKQINKDITTNQSRTIIKKFKRLKKDRITVKGVTRPLTNEEIAKRLRSDFKQDKARLTRILETETHRQNELVKTVVAKGQGFNKKTWNTQRDSKVRDSHAKLDRVTIPINAFFNVGGHRAQFPGDPRLPPEESINCRCFLTHT